MSTQQHDNITRQKMFGLNEIPAGVSFNADTVWTNIEALLQPKKRNRGVFIWWSAAALLIVCIVSAILIDGEENVPSKTDAANKETIQTSPKHQLWSSRKWPDLQKAAITNRQKNVLKAVVAEKEIIADTITAIPVTKPVDEQPSTLVKDETVALTNVLPVLPPAKKKLSVVHLNDLYQPVPEEIAKAEIKRQSAEEVATENEPINTTPPKTFWKVKSSPKVITTSLNDNP